MFLPGDAARPPAFRFLAFHIAPRVPPNLSPVLKQHMCHYNNMILCHCESCTSVHKYVSVYTRVTGVYDICVDRDIKPFSLKSS